MAELDTKEISVLQFESVNASRGGRPVLHNVSIQVEKGAPFAVVGESGSGKTPFLLCATGLLSPSSGDIMVAGERIEELSPIERARRIGLVFQDYQLFSHLSVRENIELAPKLAKIEGYEKRSLDLLESLRILELVGRRPHELSGGQKQRVAIARSLILEPVLLFLDEPSAALDEKTTFELAELLLGLDQRVQIVVVSHDRSFVQACCARGVRMSEGRMGPVVSVEGLMEEGVVS